MFLPLHGECHGELTSSLAVLYRSFLSAAGSPRGSSRATESRKRNQENVGNSSPGTPLSTLLSRGSLSFFLSPRFPSPLTPLLRSPSPCGVEEISSSHPVSALMSRPSLSLAFPRSPRLIRSSFVAIHRNMALSRASVDGTMMPA